MLGHICESSWPPTNVYVSRVTIVSLFCVLQTKSEAADELEKFREASEEERSAVPPSSPSLTYPSPPVFTPPPPPAPMNAPPPPPPVLPQGKPSTVAHPSTNAPVNPALAREAMLEAIRSGSAAERLKKVQIQKNTAFFTPHSESCCRFLYTLYLLCVSTVGFSVLQLLHENTVMWGVTLKYHTRPVGSNYWLPNLYPSEIYIN